MPGCYPGFKGSTYVVLSCGGQRWLWACGRPRDECHDRVDWGSRGADMPRVASLATSCNILQLPGVGKQNSDRQWCDILCAFNHRGRLWHVEPSICLTFLLWCGMMSKSWNQTLNLEIWRLWKTDTTWSDCNDMTWTSTISTLQRLGQLCWMASWLIFP